jgi:hypothetical protein
VQGARTKRKLARAGHPDRLEDEEGSMAKIMMTADVAGASEEQYRQINEALGSAPESPPDGLIVHMAANTGDGIRIVDVWESREAFDTFIQGAPPAMQQLGIPPFQPEMYPVHSMFEGAGSSRT